MHIYNHNVFDFPWPIEDSSVQALITSPPYFLIRRYSIPDIVIGGDTNCEHDWDTDEVGDIRFRAGNSATVGNNKNPDIYATGKGMASICKKCNAFLGQYGNERVPFGDEHGFVEHTLLWLKEAYRVLRDDGTIAVVIDDSYAGSNKGKGAKYQTLNNNFRYANRKRYDYSKLHEQLPNDTSFGLRRKSLMLIPERIMIGMQEMGFIIRGKLIWIRTMPESVNDRFTSSYEQIIFASKSPKYYFNLDAIKEKVKGITIERYTRNFPFKNEKQYSGTGFSYEKQKKRAEKFAFLKEQDNQPDDNQPAMFDIPDISEKPITKNTKIRNKYNRPPEETGILGPGHYSHSGICSSESSYRQKQAEKNSDVLWKNPGSVWLDYWLEGHRELIETLGVEGYLEALRSQILSETDIFPPLMQNNNFLHYAPFSKRLVNRLMLAMTRPNDIVLDPFVGSGTTVLVAEELGRKGIGFDIGYNEIREQRFKNAQKGLAI